MSENFKEVMKFMNLRKKFILSFLIMILSSAQTFAESTYVAGDVIVVLRSSGQVTASSFSVSSTASSFAETNGASLKKIYPALSNAGSEIFALIHSDDIDPEEFSKMLLKDPNVIAASPNQIVRAAVVPNDTSMSQLWGFEAINMPEAWDKEKGSSNVYVAVVDSGIDWTNPDLTANVASDLGFTAKGIAASSYAGFDNYGHGSHVAGIIGAVSNNGEGVAGINWYIRMIPVKVLDSSGSGTTDTVFEGMNYVAQLMSEGYNIRGVNLSIETYIKMAPVHDNLIEFPMWRAFKAIDEYNQAVIVVAAGNQGVAVGEATTYTKRNSKGLIFEKDSYAYPASFKGLNNMISVSAINKNEDLASYSNYKADISAPGGDSGGKILSTWIQNSLFVNSEGVSVNETYGTSMASPHVAGAAALLSANNPDMTAYQIKTCILESAASGGEGLLDVNAAIQYQEYYGTSLISKGTEGDAYSDWRGDSDNSSNNNNKNNGYDDYDYNYDRSNSSGGSGGCNGFMTGIFAVILLYPLARKFMS